MKLDHIPGEKGLPVIGHAVEIIKNPYRWESRMRERYGDMFRYNALFSDRLNVIGVDAVEKFLIDKEQCFSAERGYRPLFGPLAPKGFEALLLMDSNRHRWHRQVMAGVFTPKAMSGFLNTMISVIPERVREWSEHRPTRIYDSVKLLSQEMAATVFLGLPNNYDKNKFNKALTDIMAAQIGIIRRPLPGTLMGKGVKGLNFVLDYLKNEVPLRRGSDKSDMFTILCNVRDEEGNFFDDDKIASFGLISWTAGHDTTSTAITMLIYELCKSPEWQEILRDEVIASGSNADFIDSKSLPLMTMTDAAIKETLRIYSPTFQIPRVATFDTTFRGQRIPKDTIVSVGVASVHMDAALWPYPTRFDPLRFTVEGGVDERHRLAWLPFGKGPHACIGLTFSTMQLKVVIASLLTRYRIRLADDYDMKLTYLPLIKPSKGLPVILEPLAMQ